MNSYTFVTNSSTQAICGPTTYIDSEDGNLLRTTLSGPLNVLIKPTSKKTDVFTGFQELTAYRKPWIYFSEDYYMPWERPVSNSSLAVLALLLKMVFKLLDGFRGGLLVSSQIQKWLESAEEFFSCLGSEISQESWKL